MLLRRYILAPWLFSSTVMFLFSFLWHNYVFTDLQELTIPLSLYFSLSLFVYLVIGLILTLGIHKAIQYEWISLKNAFPFYGILVGAAAGFFVYLVIYILGMSFTKSGMAHVFVDVLWQMFEQGVGGLAVCLGIIYDLHRSYLETEQGT